jgi:hydroxymethylglutaryl-CoA reductase (NADPH)
MARYAPIPMQTVGPILIKGPEIADSVHVPMATFETPLWPSVNRGARLSQHCGGISAIITQEKMTRSIAFESITATRAQEIIHSLQNRLGEMQAIVKETSQYAKLINFHAEQIGRIIYLRLEYTTGDASGHNMTTLASDRIQTWALKEYPTLQYISVSANICADKKVSSVNRLLGRGKSVIAEIIIPRKFCQRFLKVTPEEIVNVHVKKNLLGSILAGSLHSANAHYANMLLAFYLATGQDAANIVEGSQGITHCELQDGQLYFSVNLPNIIVGTVGNGKHLDFVNDNLEQLGCREIVNPGINARRLALIAGATVLCGELSLMGALANQGELIQSHIDIERSGKE